MASDDRELDKYSRSSGRNDGYAVLAQPSIIPSASSLNDSVRTGMIHLVRQALLEL